MINHGKSDQSRGSVRVAHPQWVDQHLKSHNQSRYEVPAPSFISMEGIGYNIPPLFLRKGFINYVVRLCVTIVCPEHMKSSSVHFRVLNIVATSQEIPGKIPQNAFGPRRQSNHGVWFFSGWILGHFALKVTVWEATSTPMRFPSLSSKA